MPVQAAAAATLTLLPLLLLPLLLLLQSLQSAASSSRSSIYYMWRLLRQLAAASSGLCVTAAGPAFGFPTTIGGAISDWELKAGVEMDVWSHNVTSASGLQHGGYLNHFWSAGGKGPIGTYIADRQVVRYYIDGEPSASIAFEPAMACGSGIGYERLGYYQAGHNMKEPWGPEMSNSMMGHSARSGGGWHNRFKVPFARSIRITVE